MMSASLPLPIPAEASFGGRDGLVYSETMFGDIPVIVGISPDGPEEHALTVGHDVAISPDGSEIAFATNTASLSGGIEAIRLANMDGTGVRTLASGFTSVADISWSPDGNSLVAKADQAIIKVNLNTSEITELVHDSPEQINVQPQLAPDGKKLAWIQIRKTGQSSHQKLHICRLDANSSMTLTVLESTDVGNRQVASSFAWDPRSQRISLDTETLNEDSMFVPIHKEFDLSGQLVTQSSNYLKTKGTTYRYTNSVFAPHGDTLLRTAVSKNGTKIAVTGRNGTFIRWLTQKNNRSAEDWGRAAGSESSDYQYYSDR